MLKTTEWLALYGAVLSTINVAWAISKSKPKISIEIAYSLEKVPNSEDYSSGVTIALQNRSANTIHLTSISLVYPYRNEKISTIIGNVLRYRRIDHTWGWVHTHFPFEGIQTGLPCSLDPGTAILIFLPDESLTTMYKDAIRKAFKVQVQNQLWDSYYSKEFKHDLWERNQTHK